MNGHRELTGTGNISSTDSSDHRGPGWGIGRDHRKFPERDSRNVVSIEKSTLCMSTLVWVSRHEAMMDLLGTQCPMKEERGNTGFALVVTHFLRKNEDPRRLLTCDISL